MSQPAAGNAKPLAIPGFFAGAAYFAVIAAVVLFQLSVKRYKLFPTVLGLSLCLQVLVVVGVPIGVLVVRWRNRRMVEEKPFQREPLRFPALLPHLTTVGGFMLLLAGVRIAEWTLKEIEIWRLASALEAVAFSLLGLRVAFRRSVAGISMRKMLVDVLRLVCWLVAAQSLGIRLPRRSADPFVIGATVAALVIAAVVLLCGFGPLRSTYKAELDVFPIHSVLPVVAAVVSLLRAHFGGTWVAETLWTFALGLDALASLPQLSLAANSGGVVEEAVSHHMAFLYVSRALGLTFWWLIRTTWKRGMGCTGWGILLVYALHLILLSHYMCYYFKVFRARGFFRGVPLVCAES